MERLPACPATIAAHISQNKCSLYLHLALLSALTEFTGQKLWKVLQLSFNEATVHFIFFSWTFGQIFGARTNKAEAPPTPSLFSRVHAGEKVYRKEFSYALLQCAAREKATGMKSSLQKQKTAFLFFSHKFPPSPLHNVPSLIVSCNARPAVEALHRTRVF